VTTFNEYLTDHLPIEAAVLAMADDVWDRCEKTDGRGRTVTVKIKWADFQQCTRSQSMATPVSSRATLHEASLGLIRSVLPPPKGIRLVGVTLSNFVSQKASLESVVWPRLGTTGFWVSRAGPLPLVAG